MRSSHAATIEAPCVEGAARRDGYERRRPETTDLYKVAAEHCAASETALRSNEGCPRRTQSSGMPTKTASTSASINP